MKKIGWFSVVLILTLSIGAGLMIGCGSDGGDDGGTSGGISYTGLTTQVIIDENNAEDIAIRAYQGGSAGSAISGVDAIQAGEDNQDGRSRTLILSRALENALYRVDIASIGDVAFSAMQPHTPEQGNCGGSMSMSFTISVGDETAFNGNFNFNKYCEYGTTLSGSVSFSGEINLSTGEIMQFSMSFDALTVDSCIDSFTADGDIHMNSDGSADTITMDMLMRDNSTGKVYWVENYKMILTDGKDYIDINVSGKFYDPDYGYVVLSTDKTMRIYDGDDWISRGTLICTGDIGTMARLIVRSSGEYHVDADTDGDGTYDNNTGPMNWSEMKCK